MTKTILSGNNLNFAPGDGIKVLAFSAGHPSTYINSFVLKNSEDDVNLFSGRIKLVGVEPQRAFFYSIYPSSAGVSGSLVTAILPSTQKAPFDSSSTVMIAGIVEENYYDEEDMPDDLVFTFNQAFAPLRINVSNSDEEYESDIVKAIEISANENISGQCVIDFDNLSTLFFTEGKKKITSSFNIPQALGHGVTTNIMIKPGTISGVKIKVVTDKHTFSFDSSSPSLDMSKEKINVINLSTSAVIPGHTKKVVCYGDSFTSRGGESPCNYATQLRTLLGSGWQVVNRGSNGNGSAGILNIIKANAVADNADLVIIYMGRNDTNGGLAVYPDYTLLFNRYEEAIASLPEDKRGDYLVLGMHNRQYHGSTVIVSETEHLNYTYDANGKSYEETIAVPYNARGRFVDLYYSVTGNWKYWLVESGKYTSKSEIDKAVEYPGSGTGSDGAILGDWPQSLWYANNQHERRYVHPSQYGAMVMAKLIYEKMDELGYLDE